MTRTRWLLAIGALLGILIGWPAHAATSHTDGSTVVGKDGDGVIVIDGTKWRVITGQSDGSFNTFVTNQPKGLMFNQQAALGPTTFRENVVFKDTTVSIATKGANRIGLWFYVTPDTGGALGDSLLNAIHWYALGPRMNFNSANDSSVAAKWLPFKASGTVGDVTAIAADYSTLPIGAVNLVTTLLPGEILIPLTCNRNGVGGSTYIELNLDGQPFAPDFVSFTLRSFGHWNVNPQATFIRLPTYKTKVRMDARGYR